MNPRTITVTVKNVFGIDKIYPVSEAALIFAQLTRKVTLDNKDINLIKQLGYDIVVVPYQPKGVNL